MAAPTRVLTILKLKEIGRYAVGVDWSDRHESILPYRELRAACPCADCRSAAPTVADHLEPADVQRLGDAAVFFRWPDGHETLFAADQLRALCRCAYCIGEPNYPITRQ